MQVAEITRLSASRRPTVVESLDRRLALRKPSPAIPVTAREGPSVPASEAPTLVARLLALAFPDDPLPPHTPEDEVAFVEHQRLASLRTWRVILAWSFLSILFWWPSDFVLFHDD